MKKRIISIIATMLLLVPSFYVEAKTNGISPDQDNELQTIKVTAYTTDNSNAICASGCKPRFGICAGADWMLNDRDDGGTWVAMVWTEDGTEFLGYWEILDRGGTDAIRNGYVLDMYFDSYDECHDWMETTNGKCLVKYVKSYG